jgi:hypothetical protein
VLASCSDQQGTHGLSLAVGSEAYAATTFLNHLNANSFSGHQFLLRVKSAFGAALKVLCDDHDGKYRLPFACKCIDVKGGMPRAVAKLKLRSWVACLAAMRVSCALNNTG